MSKILRQLHSTGVVRSMLRYINWCILCAVICASLPTGPISAVAAFPLLSANNRKGLDGVTAVRRRGPHLDPWRCVGIVPVDRGVKRVHVFLHLLLIVRRKRREVGRLLVAFCAIFKAHTKRTRYTENICTTTRHILRTSLTQTKNGTRLVAALHRAAKHNTPPFQ